MKKFVAILLSLVMLLALCACGSDNTEGGGGADADAVYELSFSMHSAAESTWGTMFKQMFDEISEKTDGHVKVNIYGSGTLAAAGDVADMVKDGGCDIGWLFTAFYYGQYPLSDVISVPLQSAQTSTQGTEVLWDLYETYPEMAAEWEDYKVLQMYANPVSYIYSTKEIATMSDLSGLSIRSTSGGIAECLSGWGANVITMAPNDIYDGISKNNIQGYTFEPTGIIDFSLAEVTPYMVDMPLYQAPFVMVMNKDKYDSLPAEYQAVFDEYSTRAASLTLANGIDQYVEDCQKTYEEAGGQVLSISDSSYEEFKAVATAYADRWAEQYTTDTFDAQAYYDFCAEAYAKYAPAA
jgi:TRAP-type C4-dicarboxylate transport system substrate-binding protein